jgi:hypothetical protein
MEQKFEWVHDLIKVDEQMEEMGFADTESNPDPERTMIGAALTLLGQLRHDFQQAIEIFNEGKTRPASKIKIYGISKTHADFMLFRNGLKLLFSLKQPGVIAIRNQYMNPNLPTVSSLNFMGSNVSETFSVNQNRGEEESLQMSWGPFNEIIWTYKGQPVKSENVVRFYLTRFIQETVSSAD